MRRVQRTHLKSRALNIGTQRIFGNLQHVCDLPATVSYRQKRQRIDLSRRQRANWLWSAVFLQFQLFLVQEMRDQNQIALVFSREPCPFFIIGWVGNGK